MTKSIFLPTRPEMTDSQLKQKIRQMKKLFLLSIIVLASSLLVFNSCKKDDLQIAEKELTSNTWKLTGFETSDEYFSEFFDLMFALFDVTYDFNKGGDYKVTTKVLFAAESEEGTWSISDDGKYLTIDGNESEIISITNKELILGPNASIMGQAADEEDYTEIEGFNDYRIVFEAK
jgi:hypothetical protein